MRISFIVVALNEARHIPKLSASMGALSHPQLEGIERILVDGGSRDGTAEVARESGFEKVIVEPGASIPLCRNIGFSAATGDLISYIDADCELAVDWFEGALPFISSARPFLLGWPVRPPDSDSWVSKAWYIHWSNKNPAQETVEGVAVVRREAFRLITTRNMLLGRSTFEEVDGFDENLPTGEDTDFVFRASQQGVDVLGVPEMKVVHHGEPQTLRDFFKQQLWHANRKSYVKIQEISGGKVGGNAPRFTRLFTGCLALFLIGILGLIVCPESWPLILLLPLPGLLFLPALRICLRAGKAVWAFPLSLLYGAYGLARMIDLLGLHKVKISWKS